MKVQNNTPHKKTTYRLMESTCEADAAADCAEWLQALLETRRWQQQRTRMFVSGGKSPAAVFDQLADWNFPWRNLDILLVDERWAPDQPQDQNSVLVQQHLLQKRASAASFQSLLLDNDFERNLVLCNQAVSNIAQPDIVLLGMGLDGHIASLFPDAPDFLAAMTSGQRYVSVHPTNAPYPRISMSFSWLTAASQIVLYIPGQEKRDVFNAIVKDPQSLSPLRPLLQHADGRLTVITTRRRSK